MRETINRDRMLNRELARHGLLVLVKGDTTTVTDGKTHRTMTTKLFWWMVKFYPTASSVAARLFDPFRSNYRGGDFDGFKNPHPLNS